MKRKRESDGRKHDHAALQVMRQKAVKAVRNGQSVESVAAAYGLNVRTVFRWMANFASGGQNALLAKPIPGRPPKLSEQEMRWLARAIKDGSPQQYKFAFGLWTLTLIGALIERQFGRKLSVATLSRVMRVLGYSAQKPLYQAWQQDPALVRQWESETFPAIRLKARQCGATIYFADESGLRSDYHTDTTWAPVGRTPVVQATGQRFSVNMLSAVGPQGEFRFMLHEGSVNGPVFKEFLSRLLVGADKPVFVIADGLSLHKCKLVRDFVAKQKGKLELFILPPYSPHLNPDELVWAHVKQRVSRQLVQSLDDMKRRHWVHCGASKSFRNWSGHYLDSLSAGTLSNDVTFENVSTTCAREPSAPTRARRTSSAGATCGCVGTRRSARTSCSVCLRWRRTSWGGCIEVNDRATRRPKNVGAAWLGHRFACNRSQRRHVMT